MHSFQYTLQYTLRYIRPWTCGTPQCISINRSITQVLLHHFAHYASIKARLGGNREEEGSGGDSVPVGTWSPWGCGIHRIFQEFFIYVIMLDSVWKKTRFGMEEFGFPGILSICNNTAIRCEFQVRLALSRSKGRSRSTKGRGLLILYICNNTIFNMEEDWNNTRLSVRCLPFILYICNNTSNYARL